MAKVSESETPRRCYRCFRPASLCFCEAIPRIDNRTDVLILQHVGERFHAFNTARIVRAALRRCRLIADHNRRFAARRLPIASGAGLLYPREDARVLDELPADQRPTQLIVVDGTWHQAKTIVRDVPELGELPCYRLSPDRPGQYRIRREPDARSLSTLEATVAALRALEPETDGLDELLSAFDGMVEAQLSCPASRPRWRHRGDRQTRPRHVPPALLCEADRLVVAYGESTPGGPGKSKAGQLPVAWAAQRLGTGERFSCRLEPPSPILPEALAHMRLSPADFEDALSQDEFRRRWARFVRPDDVLVVYHHRTYQLLGHVEALQPRCLVLKSIFGKRRSGFRGLEELMAAEGVTLPTSENTSRATERLDMAVALVEHLRTHHGKLP